MTGAQTVALVVAIALGAAGVALLLLSRLGGGRRVLRVPGVGRPSVVTQALIGVCLLVGAQQVAAHAFAMDPRLPPWLVGGVCLLVIVGSIALDVLDAPEDGE